MEEALQGQPARWLLRLHGDLPWSVPGQHLPGLLRQGAPARRAGAQVAAPRPGQPQARGAPPPAGRARGHAPRPGRAADGARHPQVGRGHPGLPRPLPGRVPHRPQRGQGPRRRARRVAQAHGRAEALADCQRPRGRAQARGRRHADLELGRLARLGAGPPPPRPDRARHAHHQLRQRRAHRGLLGCRAEEAARDPRARPHQRPPRARAQPEDHQGRAGQRRLQREHDALPAVRLRLEGPRLPRRRRRRAAPVQHRPRAERLCRAGRLPAQAGHAAVLRGVVVDTW